MNEFCYRIALWIKNNFLLALAIALWIDIAIIKTLDLVERIIIDAHLP